MKHKAFLGISGVLLLAFMAACGPDPQITQFKKNMDDFCTVIAELDASINSVDAEADNAEEIVLGYLDRLDQEFQNFAALDFPEAYDYLEPLADEAGEFMSTAVSSYHDAYADGGFDEEKAGYARENSARAFKRVQVILSCLRGEDPNVGSSAAQPGE